MSRPSTASVSQPGRTRGRYQLKEQLAVGGMGVIHLAYDSWAQREVAYKQLKTNHPAQRARMTALFQREYDTLARLPHPNIVEVYDYGKDANGPYYAMELLSGSDLTDLAPLPYREACRIMRDIASALALVHARRLVHRDVSPNNVRLTKDGRAKLIDFGALTPFGKPRELVGTPAFLPPECLILGELDQRSDLYSLGAIAYWALTRRTAVRARSLDELVVALDEPIRPPSAHVTELPPELDQLVLSLLSRDPVGRPASAAYVIDRLTAIAELAPESDQRRVAYSYLAQPTLSGREHVLDALQDVVDSSAQGRGQVVVVEAHAGLGRTAVLEHVARLAQVAGATVLRAQGDLNAAPFSVARKLSETALALFPELEGTKDRATQHTPFAAARALAARSPVEVAEHHAALLSSLSGVLARAAELAPLVIVVDDVHWCDSESLALMASLAQLAESAHITLIVSTLTGHPREHDPAHKRVVEHALRLSLGELDEEQMVEFVHSLFGGVPNTRRFAQWLFSQTNGVPASSIDLARLLLQRGAVQYTLGTFTLPHDVDDSLSQLGVSSAALARLAEVGPSARALTELVSLHAGGLSAEQLVHASGLPLRDVLLSLEELGARGVVTATNEGFLVRALALRSALSDTLGDEQRRALHERLARALLAFPGSSAETTFHAAAHLLACGAEDEAAELAGPRIGSLVGGSAAHWVPLIEQLLVVYRRQGRSKEQTLQLMIPLVRSGFYGDLAAQRRHIDEAIGTISLLTGMTLATKLRRYLGGKLALLIGILYGVIRRARTPKLDRIAEGPKELINELVSMVIGGCATAASAMDSRACARFVTWLEPLSAMPKDSSGYLMREYCHAIAETSAGNFDSSSARYAQLIPAFAKPVEGLMEELREAVYLGALNGRAQAEVNSGTPNVLELADELGRGDPFFAPHAECARMAYYANRGDMATAAVHRARAEMLALQGGVSWSAVTILTVRLAYAAMLTRDAIGLVQANAELERLSGIAPMLMTCKQIGQAWLEYLRGRPEQALALFAEVSDSPEAQSLASWGFDQTLRATVFNSVRRYQEAREICTKVNATIRAADRAASALRGQLAIAEAGLGNSDVARQLMAEHTAYADGTANPLAGGNAHHEAAQLMIMLKDLAGFEAHFAMMERHFRSTGNPTLIQQCDALRAHAVQDGLCPSVHATSPKLGMDDELDSETMMETTNADSLADADTG